MVGIPAIVAAGVASHVGDTDTAEMELRKAEERWKPGMADGEPEGVGFQELRVGRARSLVQRGRPEEALVELEAWAGSETAAFVAASGGVHALALAGAGAVDRAIELTERLVELDTGSYLDHLEAWIARALALALREDEEPAREACEIVLGLADTTESLLDQALARLTKAHVLEALGAEDAPVGPGRGPVPPRRARHHRRRLGDRLPARGHRPRLTPVHSAAVPGPRSGSSTAVAPRCRRARKKWPSGPIENANSTVPIPTSPPSTQPDRERHELEHGADDPDRVAAGGDARHQPVAWSRPQARADVEAHAERGHHDPAAQERDAPRERVGLGEDVQREVGDEADGERVDHRPDARTLPQRDPGEQDHEAEQHDDRPERQAGVFGQALVEDVVGADPELGMERHGDADAEQRQAEEQPRQPAAQLGPRRDDDDIERGIAGVLVHGRPGQIPTPGATACSVVCSASGTAGCPASASSAAA